MTAVYLCWISLAHARTHTERESQENVHKLYSAKYVILIPTYMAYFYLHRSGWNMVYGWRTRMNFVYIFFLFSRAMLNSWTWFVFQERTVTIRRQTVGGFGLSIKVACTFPYCFIHCIRNVFCLVSIALMRSKGVWLSCYLLFQWALKGFIKYLFTFTMGQSREAFFLVNGGANRSSSSLRFSLSW